MTIASAPPTAAPPTAAPPTTAPPTTAPPTTAPSTTAPSTTAPCRDPDRRPRLRRPAHEPEPVLIGAHGPAPRIRRAPSTSAAGPSHAGRTPSAYGPAAAVRPTSEEADLRRAAVDTVRRMIEVLAGRRAPAHLTDVAQPHVVRYLTAARDAARTGREVTPPRRVHVARPSPDAAEITAVCPFGRRSRALAVRMDRVPDGRRAAWRASAVRLL